jgi:hypothetical protein
MVLATAAAAHTWPNPCISMMASLDHCIWFHSPPNADDWLLFEVKSPRMGSGRGFASGRLYTASREYCMSVVQEGLIRFSSPGSSALQRVAFPLEQLSCFDADGQPCKRLEAAPREVVVHTEAVWEPQDTIQRPRRKTAFPQDAKL